MQRLLQREAKGSHLTDWKASDSLLRIGHAMTWAPFMVLREAVLKLVMLSTTLLSPMTVKTIKDMLKQMLKARLTELRFVSFFVSIEKEIDSQVLSQH